MSAAFDPTGYPRRYRAGSASLLVTSIGCIVPIVGLLKLAISAAAKPAMPMILIPRNKPREAFVINAPSFKKDVAFWHWLETLGDQPST